MPPRPITAVASAVAGRLPDRVVAGMLTATYRRVEPELRRLDDFCPRRGTALDVGAWYGPWTRALARRVDRVVAVEANPEVAGVLERTAPPNVRVVRAAATDHTGEETLWVPPGGVGTEAVASLSQEANPGSQPVSVPATTIDELGLTDLTFIKLDVEGAELAALRGAESTVDKFRPVLLIELEYRRGPVDEVVDYLAGFGYRGEVLLGSTWHPLARFDLAGHQRRTAPLVRGYLPSVLLGGPRYVNNVLFRKP
jgi:FkbM family methyltransferase